MSDHELVITYLRAESGRHRFYITIWTISLNYVIFKKARSTRDASWADHEPLYLRCNTAEFDLRIHSDNAFELAESGMAPSVIPFACIERKYAKKDRSMGPEKTPAALAIYVTQALFAVGVEPVIQWMKGVRGDATTWPPVLNFCRIVRNAIAHGGAIDFQNPRAASVDWRGLIYAPSDNGRDIRRDLSSADLVALLFDLDEELEGLGAPRSFVQTDGAA